jgi:hypothetical protein
MTQLLRAGLRNEGALGPDEFGGPLAPVQVSICISGYCTQQTTSKEDQGMEISLQKYTNTIYVLVHLD